MEKEVLEHGLNINSRKFLSSLGIDIDSVVLGFLLTFITTKIKINDTLLFNSINLI